MRRLKFVLVIALLSSFALTAGCRHKEICCSAIKSFHSEPQYVCPGNIDFTPKVHFQIDNYDQNEDYCESTNSGGLQWQLWETSGGAPDTPGATKLASPASHNLNKIRTGVYVTPNQGFSAAPSPTPGNRQFTLKARHTNCPQKAQQHLIDNQRSYEEKLGLELDDGEPMQATIQIKQLSTRPSKERVCFPHLIDFDGNAQWKAEIDQFGSKASIPYIEMIGVSNPNTIEIQVSHSPPGPTSNTLGWVIAPGDSVNLSASSGSGVPRNPNGTWKVAVTDNSDYQRFINHGLDYLGAPSICIEISVRCKREN